MTDDPFLNAIRENPDDVVTRLVYADWLDEQDDPRGTFLRIEVEAFEKSEADPEYAGLRERLAGLAADIDVRWRARVCRIHFETGAPHEHPQRHPLNGPGPFYTCGGCMACEAPETEAPQLLAPLRDGNLITHFLRQPQSATEINAACRSLSVCCVDDLRYGGTDPLIITALGNSPAWCDYLIRDDSSKLVRANSVVHSPEPILPNPVSTTPTRPIFDPFRPFPQETEFQRRARWFGRGLYTFILSAAGGAILVAIGGLIYRLGMPDFESAKRSFISIVATLSLVLLLCWRANRR